MALISKYGRSLVALGAMVAQQVEATTGNIVAQAINVIAPGDVAQPSFENISLGNQKIGNAKLECILWNSISEWGILLGKPSGILYLDLIITHSTDIRLQWAQFELNFRDSTTSEGNKHDGPQVTQHLAPSKISGDEFNLTVGQGDTPARGDCQWNRS